ncbi:winged helix-turn-helix domain-containing protein [Wohlfahrtiimonas chitiniclastica]|uniref:winged helix-turn-helix domain-containing protein n=1 Tax=Wohlfahrtiimonas chitiniclastica TaxID=400946 RepID=UPI001BCF6393|nr:winged helix-turn-helix domain-containing protein [Wohlfahrtiimonas chitiniclastica]MBS7828345.1 winged helix-turn-helix domain-containing protein [Wohlfahrtiimonas chitiniclastica]
MSKHILIIEDDTRLAGLTSEYLQMHGFTVTCHARGDTAEATILHLSPDLVILDVLLPGKSGFDICRDVRPFYTQPILILTASEDNIDEIIGLELGADDYLTKPVEPRRLLARIRVLLRRQAPNHPQRLVFGDLTIDGSNRTVQVAHELLDFTTAEFDLLWLLASRAGTILTRDDLLNDLRGITFDGDDRSIDAKISRVRKKLQEDPDNPTWIKTVRGKGYLFTLDN